MTRSPRPPCPGPTLRSALLALLDEHPRSLSELWRRTRASRQQILPALEQLEAEGLALEVGGPRPQGHWRDASEHDERRWRAA